MMFERAEQRSTELENSYALLDRWKNKSDELLYSMIPQTVADRLRAGVSPLSTCEVCKHTRKIFSHLPMPNNYKGARLFTVVWVDHGSLLRIMRLRLLDHRRGDGHRLVHERGFLLLRHADGSVQCVQSKVDNYASLPLKSLDISRLRSTCDPRRVSCNEQTNDKTSRRACGDSSADNYFPRNTIIAWHSGNYVYKRVHICNYVYVGFTVHGESVVTGGDCGSRVHGS